MPFLGSEVFQYLSVWFISCELYSMREYIVLSFLHIFSSPPSRLSSLSSPEFNFLPLLTSFSSFFVLRLLPLLPLVTFLTSFSSLS